MTLSTPHRDGFALLVFGLAWAAALPAAGQSLTGNVGSAAITKGEQAVETRLGVNDRGDAAARSHYDYAFTEWFQTRLIGSFRRPDGRAWEASGATLETWLQWREEARDGRGFNGGFRLAYTVAVDDGPDEVGVRLAVTDRFAQNWEWRANLIGELEAGPGSDGGVALQTRAQVTRSLDGAALGAKSARLGGEILSEFGDSRAIPGWNDQAHQIGPVAKLAWGNGVFVQTAVRFGLTGATDDSMAKVFVGREF